MEEFKQHLEEINGGPLVRDVEQLVELEMVDAENDKFDLFELEQVKNAETEIDREWRNETRERPQRRRPRSEEGRKKYEELQKLYEEGAESWDTSSHNSIDYKLDREKFNRSFTFGEGEVYKHIKRQRLVKRSLSAGNFNWNLLVKKQEQNEE